MRKTATAALVVLVVAAAGCTADEGSEDARAGVARSEDPAAPRTDGAPDGSAGDAGDPTPIPTVTGGSGGQSGGDGSEVIPEPGPTPSSLAELLPHDVRGAGRLEKPPKDASNAQGLATGFPIDVLLVPEDAKVASSSVVSEGSRTQLMLEAALPGSCGDILIDLRSWYRTGGFTEQATAETAERAELTFARDDGHLTLTTETDGDACDLTVFGVLKPDGNARS